ncbi:2OG-Fe(II) oxygenase [Xenorhabdus bovienii]|uniref:2OG-Fe(II) oxygenase n=1 Tax=Xenorhabdus bovienii TaxID=40576 RepID=UPI0023B22373|nr:2OG-Fe(II) oxygenase [Xenorhabdus bovienii]MDE9541065.1 2OG-Fe(II) oxygenase [Xenorhabdus bovienii]
MIMNFSDFQTKGPWQWSLNDNLLERITIKQLNETFPANELLFSERTFGSDKTYICKQLPIYNEFHSNECASFLDPVWHKMIVYIKSEEYRRNVGDIAQCDLSNAWIEVVINQYDADCYMSAHTDRLPKLATHLIYLSNIPESSSGGEFVVFDEKKNPVHAVQPVEGRSIIFKRTNNSWHAVNPVKNSNFQRRSVQIVFWQSEPEKAPPGRQIY